MFPTPKTIRDRCRGIYKYRDAQDGETIRIPHICLHIPPSLFSSSFSASRNFTKNWDISTKLGTRIPWPSARSILQMGEIAPFPRSQNSVNHKNIKCPLPIKSNVQNYSNYDKLLVKQVKCNKFHSNKSKPAWYISVESVQKLTSGSTTAQF